MRNKTNQVSLLLDSAKGAVAKLNKIESSFFTGVRQAKKVVEKFKQEHHEERGQAELVPKIRNGQSEEEGFYFPRR